MRTPASYRPTPPPHFTIGDTVTMAHVDSVIRYVDSVRHTGDSGYEGRTAAVGLDFDSRPGAGDRQLLHREPCPPCARHGPLVTIQPEKGSYGIPRRDFARGRVIAKLINESPDSTDERYGLTPGAVVYWWADDRPGKAPRSIFFRVSPTPGFVVRDLEIEDHGRSVWWQGMAGWVWGSAEMAWASCGDRGCCRSGGVALEEL
ncbi:MAG: hypothetical protein ACREMJ_04175 [Gemmatimonadales bacterium]